MPLFSPKASNSIAMKREKAIAMIELRRKQRRDEYFAAKKTAWMLKDTELANRKEQSLLEWQKAEALRLDMKEREQVERSFMEKKRDVNINVQMLEWRNRNTGRIMESSERLNQLQSNYDSFMEGRKMKRLGRLAEILERKALWIKEERELTKKREENIEARWLLRKNKEIKNINKIKREAETGKFNRMEKFREEMGWSPLKSIFLHWYDALERPYYIAKLQQEAQAETAGREKLSRRATKKFKDED